MGKETASAGIEFLKTLVRAHRAGEREAMSYASVANHVEMGRRMQHAANRHDAQVDAYLQARYESCGKPDVYKPPKQNEKMGSTLINCTFNSDKAVEAIGQTIQQVATADGKQPEQQQPEPESPQPQPQPEPQPTQPPPLSAKRQPWWARSLQTLGAVGLGAGITYGTAKYFAGDSDQYDLRGQFRVPPHLLQEGKP